MSREETAFGALLPLCVPNMNRTYAAQLLDSIEKEKQNTCQPRSAAKQQQNETLFHSFSAANATYTQTKYSKYTPVAVNGSRKCSSAVVICVLLLLQQLVCVQGGDVCEHTTGRAPIRPYPGLNVCTPYTASACCSAAMDTQVKEYFNQLVPESCDNFYPELVALFCHACDPTESSFVTVSTDQATGAKTTTVTLCKTFATNLWLSDDFASPSRRFDNCGLTVEGTTTKVVTPSVEYKNLDAFLAMLSTKVPNFFASLSDPITFKVASDDTNCFTGSSTHTTPKWLVLMLCVCLFFGLQ
eukprot:GDKI01027473.1.p1 GENE.GDKI01027473.1~~GDKI01027473.1.p1  ORF type:complete len:299 (+),score=41.15 GDKI01027473.1:118-1014(+)